MRRALLVLLAIVPLASAQRARETQAFRPTSLDGRLFRAVQDGNVEAVRALLGKGANASGNEPPEGVKDHITKVVVVVHHGSRVNAEDTQEVLDQAAAASPSFDLMA